MFNWRKKSKSVEYHKGLLNKVFYHLGEDYEIYQNQINDGIVSKVKRENSKQDYFKIIQDIPTLNKYEDKLGRYFSLNRIKIYTENPLDFADVEVRIGFGVILGYKVSSLEFDELDSIKIDSSSFYIQYFDEEEKNEISRLLKSEDLELINPSEVYELEIKNRKYLHLKELDDGDFVAVDLTGGLYKISHNPFIIEKIDVSLTEYLSAPKDL
jgi:hypothetical protein